MRRAINYRELQGKTVSRAFIANWCGALVIETDDNCVLVSTSSYDTFKQRTETECVENSETVQHLIYSGKY